MSRAKEIEKILMERDGLSQEAANEEISLAREQLNEYLELGQLTAAGRICEEFFGFEPDYIEELF